jgi:F-type H+-transporting ATPase subunit b
MTIDWWTLGLQAANVLILVWLLARFFWKPVADMIASRRDAIAKSLAQAEASRTDAAAQQAAIAQTRAGFAAEREAVLAAAHDEAEKARAAQLAKAGEEIEALRRNARAALAKERQAAEEKWRRAAGELAVQIAMRLVGRLDDATLRRAFFDDLLRSITSLPEVQRQGIAAGGLDLVTAWPLTAAEATDFGGTLAASLGCGVPRLAADPALIAGFELRSPHLVVSNSWKTDLDRIGEELRRAA